MREKNSPLYSSIATTNKNFLVNNSFINACYRWTYDRSANRKELDRFSGMKVKDVANIVMGKDSPFAPAVPTQPQSTVLSPLGSAPLIITQGFRANPGVYGYGAFGHTGIDLHAPTGTPLYACIQGVARLRTDRNWLGRYTNYGKAWTLDWSFPDGSIIRFLYGHMLSRDEKLDNKDIPAGTYLGEADSTGRSTASHLHLELRLYEKDSTIYTLLNPVTDFLTKYSLPSLWN